jgi:arylsulfatase A-like enzyme
MTLVNSTVDSYRADDFFPLSQCLGKNELHFVLSTDSRCLKTMRTPINYQNLIRLAAVVAILVSEVCETGLSGAADDRPNVIIFLADDQGYGDFSYTGNDDIATPNIDGLARDGAFVQNFYVSPVCSPTRAEFLTGRYASRCGVYSTSGGGERLDLDESTIADEFKSAGYATAAFGKWHNGMQAPFHPNSRGFDEFYGFCSGHWGHYFEPMLEQNGELVRGDGYCADDFTNHGIEFIEANKSKPFFLYLPYNTPHSPMQVPEPHWQKFKNKRLSKLPPEFARVSKQSGKGIDHARAALAMCENIDDNVGRVLAKLEDAKLAENTIVVYFSDNGPNGVRYNAGLKGRKGSTDEGGVHSPLFIRWPTKVKPGSVVKNITGAIDLYPTLAEICGIKPNPKKSFDGISFGRVLLGDPNYQGPVDPRMLFSHWRNKTSVRWGQYRLDNRGVLYDLSIDPSQSKPVKDNPSVKTKLKAAVDRFKKEVAIEVDPNSRRNFPIGHASMVNTQVPARDAVATGEIKRSSKHPNCSYFTNWVDVADTISWPVEILEAGNYQVELHYCLAVEDVGAVVQLSCGQNQLSKKIDVPYVSKLIGAAQDRSVRSESLVKRFKPIRLGQIKLEQGEQQLVLRTVEKPGNQSIEFRLLMFRRVGNHNLPNVKLN